MFQNLNLIKARDLILTHQWKFVFDFFNHNLPVDFDELFQPRQNKVFTKMNLKNFDEQLLYLPKINTETYGNKQMIEIRKKYYEKRYERSLKPTKN